MGLGNSNDIKGDRKQSDTPVADAAGAGITYSNERHEDLYGLSPAKEPQKYEHQLRDLTELFRHAPEASGIECSFRTGFGNSFPGHVSINVRKFPDGAIEIKTELAAYEQDPSAPFPGMTRPEPEPFHRYSVNINADGVLVRAVSESVRPEHSVEEVSGDYDKAGRVYGGCHVSDLRKYAAGGTVGPQGVYFRYTNEEGQVVKELPVDYPRE